MWRASSLRSSSAVLALLLTLSAHPALALESSNLDLVTLTAQQAVTNALTDLTLPSQPDGSAPELIGVASASSHPSNWLFEHLLIQDLLNRGLAVAASDSAGTRLSWRVVDLSINGQSGMLGGSVTRRCRVVLRVELHEAGELIWSGDGHGELRDRIPKGEIDALQHSRFGFAKTDLQQRTWGKFVEPVIITSVLGSLVYLFFSNR
jgi:hypothetical protein